jgi:hypothetical protein
LQGKYAFQSMCWRNANLTVMHLTEVHRTREALLLEALTAMRMADTHHPSIQALKSATSRPLPARHGIEPTKLFPLRNDVHSENERKLLVLDPASRQILFAHDSVELHENAKPWVTQEKMLKDSFFLKQSKDGQVLPGDCQAPAVLELRTGAQVMLLKNESHSASDGEQRRLVNGSRGVIIAWDWALPKKEKEEKGSLPNSLPKDEKTDHTEGWHGESASGARACAYGLGESGRDSQVGGEAAKVEGALADALLEAQRRGESDYLGQHSPTSAPHGFVHRCVYL